MDTSKVKETGVGEITIQGINPPTKLRSKIIISVFRMGNGVNQQLLIFDNTIKDWYLKAWRVKSFDTLEQAVSFANKATDIYVSGILKGGQIEETY